MENDDAQYPSPLPHPLNFSQRYGAGKKAMDDLMRPSYQERQPDETEMDKHTRIALNGLAVGLFRNNDEMIAIMGLDPASRWAAQKRIGWSLWRRIKDRWLW
ncbi:hypothetical protein SEA_LESNORAH_27 [Microbacterium phage LesNorah]|nr:hypothetical protein SEA_LESNORAH_27 [Microbacterium phage LesNorah]